MIRDFLDPKDIGELIKTGGIKGKPGKAYLLSVVLLLGWLLGFQIAYALFVALI